MSRSLILRPPAKINLTLAVGPLRADGYHEVRTLVQSIALSDAIVVTERRGPFSLATRAPGVPTDRTNLVWKAAAELWRALGREGEPRDVHIKLDKHIPTEAGLGGGSGDAAATLAALNVLWDGRRQRRDLLAIARRIGADVPFALQGGTAYGVGRGDELYPVDDVERLGVVVIKPSFGVGTGEAYRWLDEDRAAGLDQPPARADVDVGWSSGPIAMSNDLQGAVSRRHPGIGEMVAALTKTGAMGAAMTGSGSAAFGLFSEAGARNAVRQLQRPDWLVVLTRTLTRREASRRIGV